MTQSLKPSPVVTVVERPFWDAAKKGDLIIQKCVDCNQLIFYPRIYCPHCHSAALTWEKASGKGKVYTYTVVVNNPHSSFLADMPFVIAIVKLEEGVQMLSNIVGCRPEDVTCDMPVEVVFEKLNDEFTLPKFKPVKYISKR
jgi:hypothetical protein